MDEAYPVACATNCASVAVRTVYDPLTINTLSDCKLSKVLHGENILTLSFVHYCD